MAYAGYRVALDDEPYTYASFCAWYGNAAAERIWQESPESEEHAARARMEPTATEHGNPPHTQIAPAATEHGNTARTELVESAASAPSSTATEHGNPPHTQIAPAATEHGNTARTELAYLLHKDARTVESAASAPSLVRLTLADAEELRRREKAITPKRSLHKLAREALNSISQAATNVEHTEASLRTEDLETWFPWRAYIACHPRSSEIIGSGVTHATAEFINGTQDPNRAGQRRLDFIVRRSDGTLCRLHPGGRRSGDAKLIFS